MEAPTQSQAGKGSSIPSDCLLEMPFEVYTDSSLPYTGKNAVRVSAVSCAGHVGRSSLWQQALGWLPSLSKRQSHKANDEEDLPLLSEGLPQRKRSCRSRLPQYFWRSLLVFFLMLYVSL